MQNLPARHAHEDELERYSLDFLPSTEAEVVREHLVNCEYCRTRLSVLGAEARAARTASADIMHHPPRTWIDRVRDLAQLCASRLEMRSTALAWKFAAAAAVLFVCIALVPRPWDASGPPLTLALHTSRGDLSSQVQAPAGRQLRLEPDMAGISPARPVRSELVNGSGQAVIAWKGGGPLIVKRRLPPGQYILRLYGPDLLREFGLRIVK